MEIDIESERASYTKEVNDYIAQLQQIDKQRDLLIKAIGKGKIVLAYLDLLEKENQEKEAEDGDDLTGV
jgi:hypothetical protein